jgi:hypothetical protein
MQGRYSLCRPYRAFPIGLHFPGLTPWALLFGPYRAIFGGAALSGSQFSSLRQSRRLLIDWWCASPCQRLRSMRTGALPLFFRMRQNMKKHFPSLELLESYVVNLANDLIKNGISDGEKLLTVLDETPTTGVNEIAKIKDKILAIKNNLISPYSGKFEKRFNNILDATEESINEERENIRKDNNIIVTNILALIILMAIIRIIFKDNYQLLTFALSFFFGHYAFWGFKRKRFPLAIPLSLFSRDYAIGEFNGERIASLGFVARGFHAIIWSSVCSVVALYFLFPSYFLWLF